MRNLFLLAALALPLAAQLTPDQRVFELQALAATYARNYAPYEWKKQLYNFDLFDLRPWVARARAAKDDIEFFEIASEYVASLRDTHTSYGLPSTFVASTGLHADLYDGKVIIDNINRTLLPIARFPFQNGDEIVSVDGKLAEELVTYYRKFSYSGNERSARRLAALRLVSRSQFLIPRPPEVGENLVLVVKRQALGTEETYTIPWNKSGQPVGTLGPVPSPRASEALADDTPDYLLPLQALANESVPADEANDVLNYGSLAQVWAWPAASRYVARPSNFFRVGIFQAETLRVGYIRIPNFSPSSQAQALADLESHIRFFNDNTDGLIIDVMRNTGGSACYNEEVVRRLVPYNFRVLGREIRANRSWLNSFSNAYESARFNNAETWVIQTYEVLLAEMKLAFSENRARTGPLPICSPSLDRLPAAVTYNKPLMLMTDEFSTSAADGFPAMLQDARRGPIFGYRTNGAGGTVQDFSTGLYSEAVTRSTIALQHRQRPIVVEGYPTSNYVENVGVQPDIPYDYMTLENLLTQGRPFVEAFSKAIAEHIRSNP
jgi:Peptidase family S41